MATATSSKKSNLELANECDNFPYFDDLAEREKLLQGYYRFKFQGVSNVLGYMPNEIAERFPLADDWQRNSSTKEFIFCPQHEPIDAVHALAHRNKILAVYLRGLKKKNVFKVLAGWRDELYPVYGPDGKVLFSMERSATPLFGVVTYGIHMTAYTRPAEGMKIWTPRRSDTKQTYPGALDNTVAGGLSTDEIPFECMLRESMEEASLSEEVARKAKSCGTLTYHYLRGSDAGGEVGLSQPECQYIYDLELPESVIPQPNDQEAVDFKALTIDEVNDALAAGRFKPNCALLLLEFFVRHGIITPENEPGYIELVSRFHRRLEFPTSM